MHVRHAGRHVKHELKEACNLLGARVVVRAAGNVVPHCTAAAELLHKVQLPVIRLSCRGRCGGGDDPARSKHGVLAAMVSPTAPAATAAVARVARRALGRERAQAVCVAGHDVGVLHARGDGCLQVRPPLLGVERLVGRGAREQDGLDGHRQLPPQALVHDAVGPAPHNLEDRDGGPCGRVHLILHLGHHALQLPWDVRAAQLQPLGRHLIGWHIKAILCTVIGVLAPAGRTIHARHA
mmetsp:Transcript_19328/g.41806  ORF Transcript_19328/g.41806 Transcript_19328/m.41806 type:complete len:238 (-) Transcript_19328:258-971(-)